MIWIKRLNDYGVSNRLIVLLFFIAIVSIIAETVSVGMFLPIFELINQQGTGGFTDSNTSSSVVEYIRIFIGYVGLDFTIEVLLLLSFGLFLSSKVLLYFASYIQIYYSSLTVKNMKDRLLQSYLEADSEYYDQVKIGDFINISFDLENIRNDDISVQSFKIDIPTHFKIIKKEGGDEKILVTTMYLHDIGYGKFLKNDYSLDDRLALKKKHMIVGAKLAKKILKRLNYTKKQIKMIAHLIKIHDNMKKIKKKHEIMVMEADSLSQIDHKKLKPSINKKDYMRFLEKFKNVRMSKFKTKTGKQNLKQLLKRINKR